MKPENWWASTSSHQAGTGSSHWHERGGNSQVHLAGHWVDFTAMFQGEQVTDSWKSGFWCPLNMIFDLFIISQTVFCMHSRHGVFQSFPRKGPTELHLITKSSLDSYCLFRRIFTASLEWALSDADQQKHCKARQASDVPKSWIPLSVKPWIRLASVKTSRRRNEFLLSAALPLAFQSWEKVEVELVKCRHEGCIEAVRSPGSASSHTKQSSKISHIS